ncbi:MAG: hemerythrin family protein [Spirochaetes bacterium]|nr:hemerythrin family protein [Spirochaetota bacterium]
MKDDALTPFQWSPEYETGIEIVDRQHREMFARIDHLAVALYEGKGRTELEMLVIFLEDYVHEHFSEEERLMLEHNYPGYSDHRAMHANFIRMFEKIKREINVKGSDRYLALQVEREVRGWWLDHVMNTDRDYIPFVVRV